MKTPVHAINRFKKNIGHELTFEEFLEIENQAKEQVNCELVNWNKEQQVAVYKMIWRDLSFYAVFHLEAKKIISFKNLNQEVYDDPNNYYG